MPGQWPAPMAWLKRRGQGLDAIVLTPGHTDHPGIIRRLSGATGQRRPQVLALTADWARAGLFTVPPIPHAEPYTDGQRLDVTGHTH